MSRLKCAGTSDLTCAAGALEQLIQVLLSHHALQVARFRWPEIHCYAPGAALGSWDTRLIKCNLFPERSIGIVTTPPQARR